MNTNTADDTAEMTIREFQKLIRTRYYQTDKERGTPGTFIWFMEEIGELASAIGEKERGREDRDNLHEEFADVFAWLCTLANINDIDLADALKKYTVGNGVKGTKT